MLFCDLRLCQRTGTWTKLESVGFCVLGQVASRVLTAEESLRFAKAQLEVMKAEFAAASAQLTAVQTELATQKAG